jgi:hypothetical protein
MSLKVLSISKNRIETLPSYIGHMNELRILKIDHNPVVFPPPEVTAHEGGEDSMDEWLVNLKGYLRSYHGSLDKSADDSDIVTTDEEGAETDFNTISKSGQSDQNSTKHLQLSSSSSLSTGVPATSALRRQPPPPIPTKNSHRNAAMHGMNSKSVSGMRSFQLNPINPAAMERSRSNSESDDLRRPFRRPVPMMRNRTGLGTLVEDRARHSRGFSHDYIQENPSEAESNLRSPAEVQQNSRAYFRRLSSLPQSKRNSLSSAKIVEAARGILFSLSQIHMAIRQYVSFCADPDLTGTINRVLYNANAHVGALVDVLEAHETRPDGAEATPVIEACRACVGAFRHVINILHNRIRDLTSQADVRYTRTLLLLLFGAAAEIQNSWNCLNPVPASQAPPHTAPVLSTPVANLVPRTIAPPTTRLKSNSNVSLSALPLVPSSHKLSESFSVPATPAALGSEPEPMETDEQVYEKISQATTATLSLLSLLGDAVSKSAIASAQGPATPGAVAPGTNMKLRDLAANSLNAGEVTRRLRNKLTNSNLMLMQDVHEKKKFWEDTNLFVKAVINVAALAKSISSEYPFSKSILASLSTVTRSTKELTILLSVSSFSQTIRTETTQPVGPVLVPTPMLSSPSPSVQIQAVPITTTMLQQQFSNLNGISLPMTGSGAAMTGTSGLVNPAINRFEAEFSPPAPPILATPHNVALVMNGT